MQAQPQSCFITDLVSSFRFEDAKLPSLPNAVIYLQRAIRDESISLSALAELLEKDPVLAVRLIRVANSSFYRGIAAVETVPDAVTRIGFSATRNIALVLLRNSFQARHELVANRISELWAESLRTASIAAALTKHYPLVDSNRAMLGGLMYNVGAMLLLTIIDEKVKAIPHPMILDHMIDNHAPLFGSKLLEFWEMDPDLQAVVTHRDHWDRQHAGHPDLTDLVLVSRQCVPAGKGIAADLKFCERMPSFLCMKQFLRLTRPLVDVVDDAQESIDQTLAMLSA